MDSSIGRISAATVRDWIGDGHELALLDAREEGEFATGHLFWAVPCPLSRAELRVPLLLPRLSVRTICIDDGSGLAERLAAYLLSKGATDVHVLDGGTQAWADHGFVLFTGTHVPGHAFGMWIERQYGTESIDAADLRSWLDARHGVIVFDMRPSDETRRGTIHGAVHALTASRLADLAPDPNTAIVVAGSAHAGSVLGAESLRRAGVPNRVLALRGGIMGWELAGLPLTPPAAEQGGEKTVPAPQAIDRPKTFAESSGVGVIGALDLARFEEDPARTVYVLDVRSPAEYAARHRPGSRNAPGAQLIEATDTWIGVHGARIALIDAHGVRGRVTGAWLHQMGHRDVFLVEGGLDDLAEPGPPLDVAPEADATDTIPEGALMLDFARSTEFRAGHVPGAIWAVRTRLAALRDRLAAASHIVLTAPLGILSRLAVAEVRGLTDANIEVLRGGTRAWAARGNALAATPADPPDSACFDTHLRPHQRNSGVREAMQAYLEWEQHLLGEAERDGTVRLGFERAIRYAGRLALDLLLPPQCLTCDQPVDAPGQFCGRCFGQTNFITAPCCARCGVPFEAADQGGPSRECPRCRADPPPWTAARAALRYDDQARRVLLPFKYGDRIETARALAPLMARAAGRLLSDADWLVPVPLHRRRLIGRRYNQAALLARALSRLSSRPALLDGLQRNRATRPLGTLSPSARAAELAGTIRVRPRRRPALVDSRVLLIDDVLTSGATARACTEVLLAAGVARVDVLAAARVRDQHFDS